MAAGLAVVVALVGCTFDEGTPSPVESGAPAVAPQASEVAPAESTPPVPSEPPPSEPPPPESAAWSPGTGAEAGLAIPTGAGERADAVALIEQVRTAGRGPKTGYAREAFGPRWSDDNESGLLARNGCDTRNDILGRDLLDVVHREGTRGCVVEAGRFTDPYSAEEVAFAKARADEVPVDHVVSLSQAWQMGAARWDDDRRRAFANDPLNLLVTTRALNSAKGDTSPASWLPPARAHRCGYVARYVAVSLRYDLPVTEADKEMAIRQCSPG